MNDAQNETSNYHAWISENEPSFTDIVKQREEASWLLYRPLISIVVPVYETEEQMLIRMIESVRAQTYENWEICIADGNSRRPYIRNILEDYQRKDNKIKVVFLKENKHIAGNSNEALALAEGAYVGFLDHDDEIAPFALYEIVRLLNADPSLDFVYSDEDKINAWGRRFSPFFKPDWSPDLLLSVNYICHFSIIRKAIVEDLGGFRSDFDGAQDYDLFLRVSAMTSKIAHIPKILYHWRDHEASTATDVARKDYADASGVAALKDFFRSQNIEAQVSSGNVRTNYVVRYPVKGRPLISIIIPFKDRVDLLRKCVDSIISKTTYEEYELILISNNSIEVETFHYLDIIGKNPKTRVLIFNEEFNYSRINNFGARNARGQFLLFLNNDTEVAEPEWLTYLLEHAQRREIGAVGCKLLFPDGTIQHAGVIVGMTGFAGHVFAGLPDHTHNAFGSTDFVRNYLAVTGACLMVRREVFDKVEGFDERFIVCGSDVDFCLRIYRSGYRNVYIPYAVLYHHEAASRGTFIPAVDFRCSLESYARHMYARDPYYNPNLTLLKTDCSLKMGSQEEKIRTIREDAIRWAEINEAGRMEDRQMKIRETLAMIEAFDYSADDIESNRKMMAEFEKNRPSIGNANWFIPYFRHVYYGGIHTILRFADYFSKKGIQNRFVLYDSPTVLESDVRGKIQTAFPGMKDFEVYIRRRDINAIPWADISIATLWTSAYRLLKFMNTRGKFYFIQDYEALFYPAGSSYGLAEATYRFGFYGIVNSPGLYDFLKNNYRICADYFVPAVDHDVFFPAKERVHRENGTARLFFYGRPEHDRNAFELAVAAAKKLKAAMGEKIAIVTAGSDWNIEEYGLEGIVDNLGLLDYSETAELYRTCDFGMVLMFTKHTSYLPIELMASGVIVVTNHNEVNTWLLQDGVNSVVVDPSPTYITEKIRFLMDNFELRETIRENALKTTAHLHWEPEMEKIYRFIIGQQ